MHLGMALPNFAAELERQAASKRDFLASTSAISMMLESQTVLDAVANMGTTGLDAIIAQGINPTDRVIPQTLKQKLLLNLGGDLGQFPIRELAHQQIAEFCGIPKLYYDRMRGTLPELLIQNVQAWFAQKGERRLLRTLDGDIRAVLSDRYRPLDNFDLVTAILPPLMESGAKLVSQSITENKLYIKAITPKVLFEIKPGDMVQAGIVIQNSETGMGRLSVLPFTLRLICTNGMVHESFGTRKTHLGGRMNPAGEGEIPEEWLRDETRQADDKAFFMKVQDVVRGSFDEAKFATIAGKLREATERKIEADPIKVVEVTSKRFLLNDAERTATLTALLAGNDLTQWGLSQAITQMAGGVEDYDRSTALEVSGAQVVELPKREWEALLKEASTTNASGA
jgi:hypothetical protein